MIPIINNKYEKKTALVLPTNAKKMLSMPDVRKKSRQKIVVPVIVIRLLFLTVNDIRVFWIIHPKDHKPISFSYALN